MPRKCPPGIICIENYTFLFLTLLIIVILGFMYIKYSQNIHYPRNLTNLTNNYKNEYCLNNQKKSSNEDVLLNPYTAPLKDDRIFNNDSGMCSKKIPINIPTQSFDTNYRQLGILTRINGPETILPLMGRPLLANRQKWQYHTTSDKQQSVRLPISKGGRSCSGEYGCDEIFNGDTLYVEGYKDTFKATIYENGDFRYIPYL